MKGIKVYTSLSCIMTWKHCCHCCDTWCCWSHCVLNHDQKFFEGLSLKWIAKFFKSRNHHTCMHLVTILILQRSCWHFMKCWNIQSIVETLIDWITTWWEWIQHTLHHFNFWNLRTYHNLFIWTSYIYDRNNVKQYDLIEFIFQHKSRCIVFSFEIGLKSIPCIS